MSAVTEAEFSPSRLPSQPGVAVTPFRAASRSWISARRSVACSPFLIAKSEPGQVQLDGHAAQQVHQPHPRLIIGNPDVLPHVCHHGMPMVDADRLNSRMIEFLS